MTDRRLVRFPKRPARGVFLGFSGPRVAALAAAGLVALCGVLAFGAAGLLAVVVWGPLIGSAFVRVGGIPAAEFVPTWAHYKGRHRSGQTEFRQRPRPAGVMALHGDSAPLRFHVDETGAAFVEDPHRRTLTAVLAVSNPAFALIDPGDQDGRVAAWGRLQAHLAYSGTVAALQILEAVVPDRGDSVAEWYAAYGTHDVGWADEQYSALLAQTRLGSSTHRTTLSLSLDMKAGAGQIKAAGGGIGGAAEVLRADLVALTDQARQAGLSVRGWLGEAELAAIIRAAYDPDVALDARSDPAANLGRAGPLALSEGWNCLRHDSGWSTVLWISEWPREDVPPDFLHSLVFVPGVRRSLSLTCRPLPAHVARRRIRKARTTAVADRHHKARVGQIADLADDQEYQDLLDREAAINRGHTDIDFVGLITVTAPTRAELEQARAAVVRAAANSACEVRVLAGRQAQGFVAGALPVGRTVWGGVR